MAIGRELETWESGEWWTPRESVVTEHNVARVKTGESLEDKGYSLLKPCIEHGTMDGYNVITPSRRVLSPIEIRIMMPRQNQYSPQEKTEIQEAYRYLTAYDPKFFA